MLTRGGTRHKKTVHGRVLRSRLRQASQSLPALHNALPRRTSLTPPAAAVLPAGMPPRAITAASWTVNGLAWQSGRTLLHQAGGDTGAKSPAVGSCRLCAGARLPVQLCPGPWHH